MTIIESIKAERQNETREETRARALRFIERQRSYACHTADTHALTKAATTSPPASRPLTCSRCGRPKAESEMAKKDANTRRTYCKDCHAARVRGESPTKSTADTHALNKAATSSPLDAEWHARVERHRDAIRARGGRPVSAELSKPIGQAAEWLREVPVFRTSRRVAEQIARLCGDDSQVTTTFRSIADAAQLRRDVSDQAIVKMVELGWLSIEPSPQGTVFQLLVGDTSKTLTR